MQILASPFNFRTPRVILLSTLLTWAGTSRTHSNNPIIGNINEFNHRIPAYSVAETFLLENSFVNIINSANNNSCAIGVGLVYGSSGYDLLPFFKYRIYTW